MFESVIDWINRMQKEHDIDTYYALETGSLDRKHRQGARTCFPDATYIGIDIKRGPNVDAQINVFELSHYYEKEVFDTVLCLHLLEHVSKPWEAMSEINWVLRPKGYLFLSVPTHGFPKHTYPKDYWRFSHEAVTEVLMEGYDILNIEDDRSKFSKHPFINCLGRKTK